MADSDEVIKNPKIKEDALSEKDKALVPRVKTELSKGILGKQTKLICDNCYVKDRCPYFKKGQECVFVDDNIKAIKNASDMPKVLIEIANLQVQRINQMANIEKIEGGYVDSSLSSEMDRFFKMMETMKELGDNRDSVTIRAKGKGVISEIFGGMMGKGADKKDEKD